jgi:putative oxidoreductase
MAKDQGPKFAGLFVRAVIGLAMLAHGARKFGAFGGIGLSNYETELGSYGLPYPDILALLFAIVQVAAGIALVLGAFHKVSAWLVLLGCAGAIWFEFGTRYFVEQRGMEYVLALVALSLCVLVHGPGMYALQVAVRKQRDR